MPPAAECDPHQQLEAKEAVEARLRGQPITPRMNSARPSPKTRMIPTEERNKASEQTVHGACIPRAEVHLDLESVPKLESGR